MKELYIVVASMLLMLFGIIALAIWADSVACTNKWANSGLKSSYSFSTGCLLETSTGQQFPAHSYRKVD